MAKQKHEHKEKGESIIGKIIYAFLLFLPLFAIGTTCLVNTFNMSAKEESEVVYKYETNDIENTRNFINGNYYLFDNQYFDQSLNFLDLLEDNNTLYFRDIKTSNFNELGMSLEYDDVFVGDYAFPISEYGINLFKNNDIINMDIGYFDTYVTYENVYIDFFYSDFACQIYTDSGLITEDLKSCLRQCPIELLPIESVKTKDISNTFYKAIEQVENSSLFNWAKTSAIYTGITATATALSIGNTFIPMLLTYWLIISLLYFLYDIILMCVLILHKKIHQLQNSF